MLPDGPTPMATAPAIKDGQEMEMVFQTSVNPVRQKTQEIVKQSLERNWHRGGVKEH